MKLIVSGKNIQVSERLKEYAEKKIGKLDKYLPNLSEAHVEFALERTKNVAQSQVVQVTLRSNGTLLRGEERSSDFNAAIDTVTEKLLRQIERYKGKHDRTRGHAERDAMLSAAEAEESNTPRIVRVKKFHTPPMTDEEAIEQMELLGHTFFIFQNRERGVLNVLYRRNDGSYGLIEPELG
ncbi:MAG: ribosome-associated translation inhibitor RaiA [Chloroflexi bacterium]|nr:ribosome-associated translation inhibitor RaiA [Chloroflexota bacterium]